MVFPYVSCVRLRPGVPLACLISLVFSLRGFVGTKTQGPGEHCGAKRYPSKMCSAGCLCVCASVFLNCFVQQNGASRSLVKKVFFFEHFFVFFSCCFPGAFLVVLLHVSGSLFSSCLAPFWCFGVTG